MNQSQYLKDISVSPGLREDPLMAHSELKNTFNFEHYSFPAVDRGPIHYA